MASTYTTNLGLTLPTTGELAGTWGSTVNTGVTSLIDSAIAGTETLSTDADVTLTTTTGAANQARMAILNCTGARSVLRNITAPAATKEYTVINATTGGFSVVIRGVGPTTGVTVLNGQKVHVAWNGTDFVKVSSSSIALASEVTGTLPIANGGTGATTLNALAKSGNNADITSISTVTGIGNTAITHLQITNTGLVGIGGVATSKLEVHDGTDINMQVIGVAGGVKIQGINDAKTLNIPVNIVGTTVTLSSGATTGVSVAVGGAVTIPGTLATGLITSRAPTGVSNQTTLTTDSSAGYSFISYQNSGAYGKTYDVGVGGATAAAGLAGNWYVYSGGGVRLSVSDSGAVTIPGTLVVSGSSTNSVNTTLTNTLAGSSSWVTYVSGSAGPSGNGDWGLYNGSTRISITPAGAVTIPGTLSVTGASSTLGYGTGSGGTVTQATSKSTAVTLNKATGQITMNAASLAAGTSVTFTVNSSLVSVNDAVLVTHVGDTDGGNYRFEVVNIVNGSFNVRLTNISGGAPAEAVILNFVVIKGATS